MALVKPEMIQFDDPLLENVPPNVDRWRTAAESDMESVVRTEIGFVVHESVRTVTLARSYCSEGTTNTIRYSHLLAIPKSAIRWRIPFPQQVSISEPLLSVKEFLNDLLPAGDERRIFVSKCLGSVIRLQVLAEEMERVLGHSVKEWSLGALYQLLQVIGDAKETTNEQSSETSAS